MSTLLEALKKSERARRLARAPAYHEVGAPSASIVLRSVSLVAVVTLVAVLAWSGWLVTRPPATPVNSTLPVDAAPAASSAVAPKQPEPAPVAVATAIRAPETPMPAARAATPPRAANQPPAVSSRIDSHSTRANPAPGEAPWLSELPGSFRERLPPLVVNIHVYSPNVAQRILYINNRPCQPGQEIGGGVVVEDILPDGVLLSFDHQRFRLPRPS